jgi:hypothetical protein
MAYDSTTKLALNSCRLALATLPLFAGIACDGQAPLGYLGESLLHAQGSVQIEAQHDTSQLEPAIAFTTAQGNLHIVDAHVQGEFPNRFALDIYDVPPADSYRTLQPELGKGRIALAYITAVEADHPAYVPIVTSSGGATSSLPCEGTVCNDCPPEGCITTEESCTGLDEAQRCYEETLRCPKSDSPHAECQLVSSSGDPSVVGKPWSDFAGVSENYVLAYFDQAQLAGSELAYRLGQTKGLTAGYHLFEVHTTSETEQAAFDECETRAQSLAATRYNTTHGTNYSVDFLKTTTCIDDVCNSDETEAFFGLVSPALRELKCPQSELVWTLIPHPETQAISVRLGRDITPDISL